MRNISFSLTTPQFIAGTKDVTRRCGWKNLKAGEYLMAIEKGMGLKKGEKVKKLGLIEVVGVRRETLWEVNNELSACRREGFPDWKPSQFIKFFCRANKIRVADTVTRIEFRKVAARGIIAFIPTEVKS